MEYGESYQPSPHLETWAFEHQYQIEDVMGLLENNKAAVVVGNVHSGKTSLALAVNTKLAQEKSRQWAACYTTPAVEENFFYPEVPDRTGVVYKKLPPIKQTKDFAGKVVVVIDEISNRGPDSLWIPIWRRYIKLKNTVFLLLTHPNSPTTRRWVNLFSKDEVAFYTLS